MMEDWKQSLSPSHGTLLHHFFSSCLITPNLNRYTDGLRYDLKHFVQLESQNITLVANRVFQVLLARTEITLGQGGTGVQ